MSSRGRAARPQRLLLTLVCVFFPLSRSAKLIFPPCSISNPPTSPPSPPGGSSVTRSLSRSRMPPSAHRATRLLKPSSAAPLLLKLCNVSLCGFFGFVIFLFCPPWKLLNAAVLGSGGFLSFRQRRSRTSKVPPTRPSQNRRRCNSPHLALTRAHKQKQPQSDL